MGADQHALAALDAELLIPDRDLERDVALFPLRGAGGEGAVDGHGADGEVVAFAGDHAGGDLLHELGRSGGDGRPHEEGRRHFVGHLDFVEVAEGGIDRGEVLLHDGFAALAVGFLDGVLDGFDGIFAGEHAADGKEAGLHDGIDASAHARFRGRLRSHR